MKITKLQAEKICNEYNLGKIKSFKLFLGGLVNYNYDVKTNKGNFIIRIIGHKLDRWKKGTLALEKKVLFYLNKKKFPYEIPLPLVNKKGKYYSKINGKLFWIYKKMPGKHLSKFDDKLLKSIAKALATYHKYIEDFRVKKKGKEIFSLNWFLEQYKIMEKKFSKLKPSNKTDKLVKENFNFFYDLIKKLSKMKFKINLIVCHGDFIGSNILFEKREVKSFLDFDILRIAPRVEDIAYSLGHLIVEEKKIDKRKINLFLNEYEKIVPLSKKEKKLIIPLIIRGKIITFWWMSESMKKGLDKKYEMIKETINKTKVLVKEWGNSSK